MQGTVSTNVAFCSSPHWWCTLLRPKKIWLYSVPSLTRPNKRVNVSVACRTQNGCKWEHFVGSRWGSKFSPLNIEYTEMVCMMPFTFRFIQFGFGSYPRRALSIVLTNRIRREKERGREHWRGHTTSVIVLSPFQSPFRSFAAALAYLQEMFVLVLVLVVVVVVVVDRRWHHTFAAAQQHSCYYNYTNCWGHGCTAQCNTVGMFPSSQKE